MEIGSANGYVLKGLSQLEYALLGTKILFRWLKKYHKKVTPG
jgi:hypothetical protein